jgi:TolB-like protein/predicted Ser/Thr protein kinase
VTLAPGSRLGPYEVVFPLGAGGMGEVYRARDTRLGRDVAIKVLPPAFAADPDRLRRFEQEARAVAALNHPHICQVHDVGEGYLVLEYVEGEALHGPMPVDEAVRVALQITSALEATHQRGILHRDLKPANILVTPTGQVKLLDFGLAKFMTVDADVTRTTDGAVLGTPAYMSTEQAEGRSVDARSDIFSLGTVLYEMLSGTRAFGGETIARVVSAVLRDAPPPLHVSPPLERLVTRCIAKQPPQRFQTMSEVRTALEHLSTKPAHEQASIAVLPFANMSRDSDDEYFSDGLAEEIINALTKIPGLKVMARTSAFAFRGKEQDITTIAEALRVRTILEGSVRRAGTRIRVTAQLINAEDGYHLWSERYDRELTDVFAVQDEISAAIAAALQVTLSEQRRDARTHMPNLAAYEAYLRGLYLVKQNTADALGRSWAFLEQAIALDPDYAEPHVALGESYLRLAIEGLRPARDVMPCARDEARRALALDPSNLDALAVLGVVAAVYDYDWNEVELIWRRLGSRPDVPNAVFLGIDYLAPMRRIPELVQWLQRALQHDPLNGLTRVILGSFLMMQDPARALDELRTVLNVNDDAFSRASAHFMMATTHAFMQQPAEALAAAERAYEGAPWHPRVIGFLAGLLAQAGQHQRADALIAKLREAATANGVQGGTIQLGMVQYHWAMGDVDGSIAWLEKAVERREPLAVVFAGILPAELVRSNPRWRALRRTMNLER